MSYLYNHQSNNSKIVFFFGAGASVDAGLFDVVRLVNELKQWLESNSRIEYLFMIEAIISTLRKFKHHTKDESDIDIELLLETVERIENRYNDVLQYFYENKNARLERHQEYSSVFNSNTKLSRDKTFY